MRSAWSLVVAAVILAGCGGSPAPKQAARGHTPTPTAALTQPAAPTPAGTPLWSPPPFVPPPNAASSPFYFPPGSASAATYARMATFNCRVPISNGQPGSGGFISVPGGQFTSDPNSNVTLDWTGAPTPPAGAQNGRPPVEGLSYDRAAGRWLPVGSNQVSPDGQSYAYGDFFSGGVRYVKVADGSLTVLGGGRSWYVLDVEAEGVYAQLQTPTAGQPPSGLWLLTPGKDPQQVVAGGYWQWVTTGFAYGYEAPSVPQGAPHPLLRLNLRDHSTVTWYQEGASINWIAGFDRGGTPIGVFAPANYQYGQAWETALISQPDQKATLLMAPQGAQWPVVQDAHGFWMVADRVYFNGVPVAAIQGQLGGGCA